jgi:hypothetical protein
MTFLDVNLKLLFMKKTYLLFLLFCVEKAIAQENQPAYVAGNNRPLYGQRSEQFQGNRNDHVNSLNSKAARHLFKNCDAGRVQWVTDKQETRAYYNEGGKYIKARYDSNGHQISTTRIYSGGKIDRYIAFLSKKGLDKDFTVYSMTEFSTDLGTIYEVILENKYYWSVVKIAEDNQGYLEKVGEPEQFLKA